MADTWKLSVDPRRCIGSGMCISIAPRDFALDSGRAVPRHESAEPSDELVDAWESCPQSALVFRDEDDNEVEPEL